MLQPILPTAAVCIICKKGDAASSSDTSSSSPSTQSGDPVMTLMECNACWKIVHPQCLRESYPQLNHEGVINNELPNSWECPKCCDSGAPKNIRVPTLIGCLLTALLKETSDAFLFYFLGFCCFLAVLYQSPVLTTL